MAKVHTGCYSNTRGRDGVACRGWCTGRGLVQCVYRVDHPLSHAPHGHLVTPLISCRNSHRCLPPPPIPCRTLLSTALPHPSSLATPLIITPHPLSQQSSLPSSNPPSLVACSSALPCHTPHLLPHLSSSPLISCRDSHHCLSPPPIPCRMLLSSTPHPLSHF